MGVCVHICVKRCVCGVYVFCFSLGVCCVRLCKGAINHIGRTIITAICSKHYDR